MRIGVTTIRDGPVYHFSLHLQFELEDAFCRATGGELIHLPPHPNPTLPFRALRKVGWDAKAEIPAIENGLDLLVVPCLSPMGVRLDHIRNWRSKCGKVIYYLFDAWPRLPRISCLRGTFVEKVDLFAISFHESLPLFRQLFGERVCYIPQATDPHRFCFKPPPRGIFCNAPARQDEDFLARTKAYCRQRDMLCVYTSVHGNCRRSWQDTQDLYAELMRNSVYSLNWSAKTYPDWATRVRVDPTTGRWFQAAAAGCALVGTPPDSTDWPMLFPGGPCLDVRRLGNDPARVFEFLEARPQEERLHEAELLSRHTLSRHTWYNRVHAMLKAVGMEEAFRPPPLDVPLDLTSLPEPAAAPHL